MPAKAESHETEFKQVGCGDEVGSPPAPTPGCDDWSPTSWQSREVLQQPEYPDKAALAEVITKIAKQPPLVTPPQIASLRSRLAEVAAGRGFVIQGGDCAERFLDCSAEAVRRHLRTIFLAARVIEAGAGREVVTIGRIAGQYAKPRSAPTCVCDGVRLPVFRGDNVNSFTPSPTGRIPQPQRLLEGYNHSSATLKFITSNCSDVAKSVATSMPEDVRAVITSEAGSEGEMADTVAAIERGWSSCAGSHERQLYISHEGLHLPYETALTRSVGGVQGEAGGVGAGSGASEAEEDGAVMPSSAYLCSSAHMLWIGDRTRGLEHGHVEFMRGICNPVGVKVGPSSSGEGIVRVLRRLFGAEPSAGKVVLITRMGAGEVKRLLPSVARAVVATGLPVVWLCDPMHGNTVKLESGFKTRAFDDVMEEVVDTMAVLRDAGARMGGLHLEFTGEDVTECVGGPAGTTVEQVPDRYTTYCDPRLSFTQTMALAVRVATLLQARPSSREDM